MRVLPPLLRIALVRALSFWNYLFDSLLLLFAAIPRRRLRKRDGTAVMIVRLDRIGDFVLFLPAALRMAEAWRGEGRRVTAIVNRDCAGLARDLVIPGGERAFDEVWPLDIRAFRLNPLHRARFLARVRRCAAAIALQPTFSRITSLGDAIIRFSGADRRIAWTGDCSNAGRLEKRLADRFYTERLPNPEFATNDLRLNEALLDHLGIPAAPFAHLPLPQAPVTEFALPDRYYVLAPGAGHALRRWPAANFALLARRIHEETGTTGVICGGRADTVLARRIMEMAAIPLLDLTGRTGLGQVATLVAGADFVVAHDSGIVHFAAALRKASVCITGGGHYGRFLPYAESRLFDYRKPVPAIHPMPCFGCNWICRFRPLPSGCAPCIGKISVEQVWEKLKL